MAYGSRERVFLDLSLQDTRGKQEMTKEQNLNLKVERQIKLATRYRLMAKKSGDTDLFSYWNGYSDALRWARDTIQPERIRLEALEQLREASKK